MKKTLFLLVILISIGYHNNTNAQPDTVKAGIYITSIHDIDFKQKEYNISLWLWLRYKKKEFDFVQNLEVPMAKTVTKSFSTIDTTGGDIYVLMKLQCTMKDSWRIKKFPFDKQKLRFSIENSQFDANALAFVADTLGKQFDPRYLLRGWNIDSIRVTTGKRIYETTFGDKNILIPHTEYSAYRFTIVISRDATGLFWKMFLGMYVSFLIAYMCFYIHPDSIDSRFGLNVGALFAVIGNKYVIDAALPESTEFTLVDQLHSITLSYIVGIMMCNAISLTLIKRDKIKTAKWFDFIIAQVFLLSYILLNVYFITDAMKGN